MKSRLHLAVALAMLLAACATGDPAGSEPGSAGSEASAAASEVSQPAASIGGGGDLPEACSLLSADEISGVVGNAVEDGTGLTLRDCSWGSDPDEISAAVLLTTTGTEEICVAAFEGDPGFQSVDGFSSPAFWNWNAIQGGVGSVSVCAGGTMVTVTVSAGLDDTADEAGTRSKAVELAQLALGRI
jgi:hypothetical protein